jgi:peptidoglycan/LPS O-acetylase OafA/YrhL
MVLCGGLMALGLVLRAVLYAIHLPSAAYTLIFCRADSLAIGALVALSARDPRDWKTLVKWARYLTFPALCAVVVVRVLNPLSTTGPGSSPTFFMSTLEISFVGIFFGGCLALGIRLHPESPVHRFLGSPFLRFFGKYSYCMYICHLPIIVFFAKIGLHSDRLTERLHNQLLAVVAVNGIAFAATIAISLASWNLFEKQWLKLKDLPFLRRQDGPDPAKTDLRAQGIQAGKSPVPQAGWEKTIRN